MVGKMQLDDLYFNNVQVVLWPLRSVSGRRGVSAFWRGVLAAGQSCDPLPLDLFLILQAYA